MGRWFQFAHYFETNAQYDTQKDIKDKGTLYTCYK